MSEKNYGYGIDQDDFDRLVGNQARQMLIGIKKDKTYIEQNKVILINFFANVGKTIKANNFKLPKDFVKLMKNKNVIETVAFISHDDNNLSSIAEVYKRDVKNKESARLLSIMMLKIQQKQQIERAQNLTGDVANFGNQNNNITTGTPDFNSI